MTLYSRRTFSKESFQWTKCVVKYLYDTYAHLGLNMLAFLVEVLYEVQKLHKVKVSHLAFNFIIFIPYSIQFNSILGTRERAI